MAPAGPPFDVRGPVTDDELEELRAAMREQREQIREDLEAAGVDVSSWDEDDRDDGDGTDESGERAP